jgi:hypothetical protein
MSCSWSALTVAMLRCDANNAATTARIVSAPPRPSSRSTHSGAWPCRVMSKTNAPPSTFSKL